MKHTLSVVVITKNEEEMIEGALQSISFADEVIVIDAQSTDRTRETAKKYTSHVFSRKWQGFATQKNFGISKASKDWILLLDADERVSQALAKEIQELLTSNPRESAFDIHFRNFFLGKEMKHGGWQYESHVRLFKRGKAKYADQEIHEFLKIHGETGKLSGSILHFSHRDLSTNLLKTRQYAMVQSAVEYQRGYPRVTQWTLFRNICEHFWLRYVTHSGYKDGMEGFIESVYQAFSQIFIIQATIWEHQRGKSVHDLYKTLDQELAEGKL